VTTGCTEVKVKEVGKLEVANNISSGSDSDDDDYDKYLDQI
jgi:hypothetical protein